MYNENKDVIIETLGTKISPASSSKLSLIIYSYDGGPYKLSIQRITIQKNGEERFTKTGRLTLEEALFVSQTFQEYHERQKQNAAAEEAWMRQLEARENAKRGVQAEATSKVRRIKKLKPDKVPERSINRKGRSGSHGFHKGVQRVFG